MKWPSLGVKSPEVNIFQFVFMTVYSYLHHKSPRGNDTPATSWERETRYLMSFFIRLGISLEKHLKFLLLTETRIEIMEAVNTFSVLCAGLY